MVMFFGVDQWCEDFFQLFEGVGLLVLVAIELTQMCLYRPPI